MGIYDTIGVHTQGTEKAQANSIPSLTSLFNSTAEDKRQIRDFVRQYKPFKFELDIVPPRDIEGLINNPEELSRIAGKKIFVLDFQALMGLKSQMPDIWETSLDEIDDTAYTLLKNQYPDLIEHAETHGVYDELKSPERMSSVFLNQIGNDYSRVATACSFSEGMGVVVIDDRDFSAKGFSGILWQNVKTETPPKPFPGTDNQVKACIIMHELEHTTGHHLNSLDYFTTLQEDALSKNIHFGTALINTLVEHVNEIESDIAFNEKLKNIVPEESMDWFNNARLSQHMFYQCAQRITKFLSTETDQNSEYIPDLNKLNGHDTGFFTKEFRDTGEFPDYFSTHLNIDSFYQKTAKLYAQEVKALAHGNFEPNAFHYEPPLNVLLDTVQKELTNAPSVYTLEETAIAQNFIEAMQQLDISPTDTHNYIVNTNDSQLKMPDVSIKNRTPPPPQKSH